MSTISEKDNGNVVVESNWTDGDSESTLQQLKAKKNKSNLFLIKSYSFIDKTNTNNNNNNNNINNNNNNNISNNNKSSAKMSEIGLLSPEMEPLVDFTSLVLAQTDGKKEKETRLKKPKKQKQPKTKAKSKTKTKRDKAEEDVEDINEQEAQLLRRNVHEYEKLLDQLPSSKTGSLPRPQSLPAKVHFETAASRIDIDPDADAEAPTPAKRLGANIKRESFLRQSLQSIRRSFGSNKHSSKLSIAGAQGTSPLPSRVSSNASTTSSTSSAVSSSTTSSCSSSAAISLLTKAQAHNHILDEFLPTPVVLLLNDDPMTAMANSKKYFAQNANGNYAGRVNKRSTSSVVNTVANGGNVGTDERATTSMAPLQLATTTPANKDTSGSTRTATGTTLSEQQQQQRLQQQQLEQLQQRREQYIQQLSLPETVDPDNSSLPTSGAPLQPSGSVHSLGSSSSHSQSPRSSQSHSHSQSQSQGKGSSGSTAGNKGGNTAKQHDQQTSAVAAISSTSAAAGVGAAQVAAATPPEKEKDKDKEKEKKRKEVSSSRVKKFHRHFSQVSKDEKLINYFSCALVGDIPLQGHLYITEDHFAFYSNVFGYVTKVVIPTTSVTKISKEKTAKIIPNAVGVATADERHVFGSFISREAAFRLMCTVCTQLATGSEILPKPLPVDVELTEEYLNDDDSSCSISGNESPPHLRSTAVAAGGASEPETMLRQRSLSDRHSDLQGKSALAVDNGISLVGQMIARSSAPPVVYYEAETQALLGAGAGGGGGGSCQSASHSTSASSSGPTSSSSSPITVVGMGLNVSVGVATTTTTTIAATRHNTIGSRLSSMRSRLRQQLPTLTELHVLYLGIMLAIMLALFSVFLLYRILDIEAKTHLYNTPVDFNLRSGNDEDLFAEALRWQKELQDKSTAEAQHILSKNLEQISKVRRSLETLSMLIHDRRAGYAQPETEMETQMDMDMEGTGGLESEPLPNDHVASSFPDFND